MAKASVLHRRAARVLPEVIRTSGIVLDAAGQRGLASMLFAMRRRSSGTMVFRLCAQTVAAMGEDPLSYLSQGRHARAAIGPGSDPLAYRPWHSAVLALAGTADGQAASVPVFFTSQAGGQGWVMVVPAERLAIYGWSDRPPGPG